jgi:uncharacterized delta-60 repeat protein
MFPNPLMKIPTVPSLVLRFALTFCLGTLLLLCAESAFSAASSQVAIGYFRENWPEDVGSVKVPIVRTGDLQRASTVEYRTVDGSAIAGADYDAVSGMLTFAPGETNRFIEIRFIYDAVREENEVFTLQLLNPDAGTEIVPARQSWFLQIMDTAPVPHAIGVEVLESAGEAIIPVRRGGAPESLSEIPISYVVNEGTAKNGQDFIGQSGKTIMPAGVSEIQFHVPILNDSRRESTEVFHFDIVSPSGWRRTDMTILDDDPGVTIDFSSGGPWSAAPFVSEHAGEIAVHVLRGSNSGDRVSVHYATEDGTATAGLDYEATAGILIFEPDEKDKIITIPIKNDILLEGSETFALRLSEPSLTDLGANTNATISIQDDDAGVGFDPTSYSCSEDQSKVRLKLFKISDPPVATEIHYEITAITAKAGGDYVGVRGTLQMGAEETSAEIVIPLLDDAILEGPESFQVTLLESSGLRLSANRLAGVVINDVEPVSVLEPEFTRGMDGTDVDRLVVQNDGKILVAAWTLVVDGVPTTELRRLNPDGSLDLGFAQGRGVSMARSVNHSSPWGSLSVDAKQRLLIAGRFSQVETKEIRGLVRLKPDGSVDEDFNPNVDGVVVLATPLSDSSVVYVRGGLPWRLQKVLEDGRPDSSYLAPDADWYRRTSLVADRNDRVLGANVLLTGGDPNRWPLVRFARDGSVDPSFVAPKGAAYITQILVQPDQKLLIAALTGACVEMPDGLRCATLFRLGEDGTVETLFEKVLDDNSVFSLALQRDGRVVAGYGGLIAVRRFTPLGAIDPTFGPAAFLESGVVTAVAALQDGSILAGCYFGSIEGSPRHIAHLLGTPIVGIAGLHILDRTVEVSVATSASLTYGLEATSDFQSWKLEATEQAERAGVIFRIPLKTPEREFYRVRLIE